MAKQGTEKKRKKSQKETEKTAAGGWARFTASFRLTWLKDEVRDFLKVFREPEAWVFILLGFVFATKALEVIFSLRGKMPLFSFLREPLKAFAGDKGSVTYILFVDNALRYMKRLPAIFYQMVVPFVLFWIITHLALKKEQAKRAVKQKRQNAKNAPLWIRSFFRSARDSGFRTDTLKEWWVWIAAIFLVMIPIIIATASSDVFRRKYPYLLQLRITKAAGLFLVYECIRGFYMLSWEYLFRGFMINTLRERFGYYTIFFQMIPYVMLHSTKPSLELYYTVPSALLLGLLAYRTRSVWPGFFLHFFGAVFFDFIALYG